VQSMKIKKGDMVHVLSGKDRGKQGRVIEARPKERRVLVENLNMIKRHTRPRPMSNPSRMGQQAIQPGGVIEKAAPIPISNVMLVCPVCNRPTRVGVELREPTKGEERRRVRVCKRDDCRETIDK
jgi:large subunit ribosomal protein L24